MDNVSLQIAYCEIEDKLRGRHLSSVHEPEEGTFVFYFNGAKKRRLVISVRPGHPRIHLSTSFIADEKMEKSPFSMLLSKTLEGLFVQNVHKDTDDKLIRFSFSDLSGKQTSDFLLMFELIGRSSNLIVTDGEERVLGYARKLRSEFRQPIIGQQYQRPLKQSPSLFEILGDRTLDRETSSSAETLGQFLSTTLKGAPGQLIQELIRRALEMGSLADAVEEILDRYRKGNSEACIYSLSPLDQLREDLALDIDTFILSPFRIGSVHALHESRFDSFNEAADRYFSVLLRNERFAARKNTLLRLIKKEVARAERILKKLVQDGKAFEDPDRYKLYGEMILAGMSSAQKDGSFVEVNDFSEPGAKKRIPIDPSLSLPQNAARYFKRFKRAVRGREQIEKRSALLRSNIVRFQNLRDRVEACINSESLQSAMEELRAAGIAIGIKDRKKREVISGDHVSGIRIFTSSDGMQILVGKSARDNMKLTFRIAAPEDFWLHASDYGGAHVVVKNSAGLKKIPDKTLAEAAKLAAFYSSAKEETKVEIHYTKKKYVRKGKNLPSGTVIVKKYDSIQVQPVHPFPEKERFLR